MSEPNTAEIKPLMRIIRTILIIVQLAIIGMLIWLSLWNLADMPSDWFYNNASQKCSVVRGVLRCFIRTWVGTAGIIWLVNLAESQRKNALPLKARLAVSAAIFVAMTVTAAGYYAKDRPVSNWRLDDETVCQGEWKDPAVSDEIIF